MKKKIFTIVILLTVTIMSKTLSNYEKIFFDFSIKSLEGKIINLSDYKNKAVLLVNVASNCGFTKQYTDLQKLWDTYKDKGLIVLGVPSNQFGSQEPGTNDEIKQFCEVNFNINFPMTEKVSVKGENAHPFYKWSKKNYGNSAVPKWNFHKIIIGKDGKIFDTFASITNPSSKRFIASLEKAIN